jgi:winged helix DNA-binding protein
MPERPPETLTNRALNRATLARQMLLQREKVKPVAAIERLMGMQAQLARPPFIGLWTRIEDFKRDDLRRAIEKRDVVRATMMRGTIHLMSRRDYLAFRAPLQPMLTRGMRGPVKFDLGAGRDFFAEPRTFDDLRKHLLKHDPDVDERKVAYAIRLHLPLIQVPTDAAWSYPGQADFTLVESWLGEPIADDAKPHALVLRYLAAFGPAGVADFQSWSGLAAMKAVFDELRPKLRLFRDEKGRELFDLPKAPRPDEETPAPVRFLPEYDSLLLAFAERARIIDAEHRKRIFTPNLVVPATFLVDGVIAGMWKIDGKKLKLDPFVKLSKKMKDELAAEGDALLQFVQG